MLFPPRPLCGTLPTDVLKADKKAAEKYEGCAVSARAIYIGGYFIGSLWYIPHKDVERVYKRLGVSKGFFEADKTFITVSYLVVEYAGGKKKVCRFTHEENLDMLLDRIKTSTQIPVGKKK